MCNIDDHPDKDATQECLDLTLLEVVNGSTQYDIEPKWMTTHVNVSLPANLTCKHCVFQWKYITGNSWGISNGSACLGCGTKNEEFYGCSDISIVNESESTVNSTSNSIKTVEIPRRQCSSAVKFSRSFDLTALLSQYCRRICSTDCDSDRTDSNYDDCRKSCEKLCICE